MYNAASCASPLVGCLLLSVDELTTLYCVFLPHPSPSLPRLLASFCSPPPQVPSRNIAKRWQYCSIRHRLALGKEKKGLYRSEHRLAGHARTHTRRWDAGGASDNDREAKRGVILMSQTETSRGLPLRLVQSLPLAQVGLQSASLFPLSLSVASSPSQTISSLIHSFTAPFLSWCALSIVCKRFVSRPNTSTVLY